MAVLTELHRTGLPELASAGDEGAARRSLRGQIARLERRLGSAAMELWESRSTESLPRAEGSPGPGARLLRLGELEAVRDALVDQLRRAEEMLEQRAQSNTRARATLEAMLAEPARHPYRTISRADLGEPGCGAFHVVPRLGLLGMLFGWWCVKLSSGCP